MVFAGTGILMSSMEVLAEEDDDFNTWSDREHIAERVAIPGFLEARRYESLSTPKRYLQIYNTVSFDVLDGEAYRAALAHQTSWSLHHIERFIAPTRVVGRLVRSVGFARGVALVVLRLRPVGDIDMLPALEHLLDWIKKPGVVSVHFVEADAPLSRPVTPAPGYVGSEDCYVVIECTNPAVAEKLVATQDFASTTYGSLIDVRAYAYRMGIDAPALKASCFKL